MQKSRNLTIFIIISLFIYFCICHLYFSALGNVYTFIIKPLSFVLIAFLFKSFFVSTYHTNRFKRDVIQYVLITLLVYVIVYLICGLFVGFGKSPYSLSIRGLAINLYTTGLVIFCIEYMRYKLIHNVYKNDTKLIFVLLVIIFTFLEFNFFTLFNAHLNGYTIFKQLFYKIIPIILKNILFTYMAYKTDYWPAVLYELLYYMFIWISPIFPNSPWVLEAILDSIFPLLLFLAIRYIIGKKDRFHLSSISTPSNPFGLIPLCVLLVILIWFALGIFPIKPVGIASGSMYPEFKVGDVAVIQKCTPNDIKINDVIEYQMDGYTVIHRVINIIQEDGEFFFITKGDNNSSEDKIPVSEDQLIGKAIFKIPYLALPTIWIRQMNGKTVVDVETGN